MVDCDDFDRDEESVTPEVTLPESVARDLMDIYPSATSLTEAVRMAIGSDISRHKQKVTPASIRNSVVDALEDSGGQWRTRQSLRIGEVDRVDIEHADDVSVASGEE